jgi:hypothetical protein
MFLDFIGGLLPINTAFIAIGVTSVSGDSYLILHVPLTHIVLWKNFGCKGMGAVRSKCQGAFKSLSACVQSVTMRSK